MNILFVVEKPSIKKILQNFIENNKDLFCDNYYFDCIKMVTHLNDNIIRMRKRDGNYYMGHKQVDFIPLKLNDIDIPIDTFLENNECNFGYSKNIKHSDMDLIIGVCDPDVYGKLAFKKYVEHYNISDALFINLFVLSDDYLKENLVIEKAISFNREFENIKKHLIDNNYECDYPRTQDVLKLRQKTNMNRKEFAKYFKIPYRTLENWEFDEALCPPYLYELMEYKLKNEKII